MNLLNSAIRAEDSEPVQGVGHEALRQGVLLEEEQLWGTAAREEEGAEDLRAAHLLGIRPVCQGYEVICNLNLPPKTVQNIG